MRRSSMILVGISLLALGCAKESSPSAQPSASQPASTPSDSPSPTPSTTAPPGVQVGAVFYRDDFKDESKGWTERPTENATYTYHTDYATPLYTVKALKGGIRLYPHPEFRGISREQLADYEVTALIQTTLNLGRQDWVGVTCRDLANKRYTFEMSYRTGGEGVMPWAIAKHDGGRRQVLAEGEHEVGGSAFEIAGACVGGADGGPATLVMKVNDKVVGSVRDDETPLTQGYGGVYLYSQEGSATINVLGFAARAAEPAS